MVDVERLFRLDKGDRIVINGISLKVDTVHSEVNVDTKVPENIKIEELGKNIFLSDNNDEYHLCISQDISEVVFEKIKRDSISHPWEYKVLERLEIKDVAEVNK